MTSETPQFVTSPPCCELVGSMMHRLHGALAARRLVGGEEEEWEVEVAEPRRHNCDAIAITSR